MRIAIVTELFLPVNNGVSTSVVNVVRLLSARGHRILVICPRPAVRVRADFDENVEVWNCSAFERLRLFRNIDNFAISKPDVQVIRRLRAFRPDVIHSHTVSILGLAALFYAKIFGVPLIGTYHGFLPDLAEHVALPRRIMGSNVTKELIWMLTLLYYGRCDVVIAPSKSTRRELLQRRLSRPILVISNGVDLQLFHQSMVRKTGDVFLHVGRLAYDKRIEVVIKAFREMAGKRKGCRLVIVGAGPQESRFRRLAGNDKSIEFKGFVDHRRLRQYYCRADVFVTASTIETEGLVILEAMACGLPVVGVNVRAIPDLVINGHNGFIAGRGDYHGMASLMEKLISDKDLRDRFSRNSALMAKRFSVQSSADKLEACYKSVMCRRLAVAR